MANQPVSPRAATAWLVLEDGTAYPGVSAGAAGEAFGEVVFHTGMTGYQEILTDPSYKGQMVCMTYPHIGNYGVNGDDAESRRPWLEGFIMRECSPAASNFRATGALDAYLRDHGIVAISGVDTRALTLKLRRQGSMKGGLSTEAKDPAELWSKVQAAPGIVGRDLVREVTCERAYDWPDAARAEGPRPRVVVMDFGVKHNILRQLASHGCRVTVVPAGTTAKEILSLQPDGVLLSNGPGDPAAVPYAVSAIRSMLGTVPMLGICLGHQLLGLACGGETFKLKFGHHGANHPVQDLATGKVEITSQNHNFALRLESIPEGEVELTHTNLNDRTVEGIRHRRVPAMSIQYHPEAAPGPRDAGYLFGRFMELMAAGSSSS
ncbi:MAG TPA: glutamine-hydrolyzing carbamoyl-phosphate synthase small subunit [bacterium]